MHIILSIDDNNGIMFNNRRQSRDSKVVSDIISSHNKVYISSFSLSLFKGYENNIILNGDLSTL